MPLSSTTNERALIIYNERYNPSSDAFWLSHCFVVPDPRLDLRLKIFFNPNQIPLLRTATGLLCSQALFAINSHRRERSREKYSDEANFQSAGPLEGNDYIRLENIRLLFRNRPSPTHSVSSYYYWLRNLSLQMDAMNVYEKLIRDSVESAFGPHKGLAAKLLSFLHHGLSLPPTTLSMEVRNHIVNVLFLSGDLTTFQRITGEILAFDCVRNRSIRERIEWLYRIERLISLPDFTHDAYNIQCDQNPFSVGLMDLHFFHGLGESSTQRQISCIMSNPMYLMGELEMPARFKRAISILQQQINYFLEEGSSVLEAQTAIEVAYEAVHTNAEEFQQKRSELVGQIYPTLQFYGGLLYGIRSPTSPQAINSVTLFL